MEVKIKKLYKDSILPTKAHTTDAGYDLYAHSKSYDNDGNVVYGSGVAMEIPQGYVGLVFPRSSNAKKDLILSNSVGVIDSGFRGEISFKFKTCQQVRSDGVIAAPLTVPLVHCYDTKERIGQIIIMPYPNIEFVEVEELSDSERGDGGYGSSGK
jgi:dUTP pyrophosphatase